MARYIDEIAAAGQSELDLPMYVKRRWATHSTETGAAQTADPIGR